MMRSIQLFFLLAAVVAFSACSEDSPQPDNNTNDIVGQWELIEQLADPGDGSGTFSPVNSQKTIEFFSNNTWAANGNLCFMTIESNQNTSGTYSDVDKKLMVPGCNGNTTEVLYEIDNGFLILSYPCIEPCQQKYEPAGVQ